LQIDLESLRRHYASLSDEALLALDRAELVEAAQTCYDEELAQRDLAAGGDSDDDAGDKPDWLEEAGCACTFTSQPGNPSAPEAEDAREVLEAAGIPCYVTCRKADPPSAPPPQPRYEYRLMVPGNLNMQAASVLDKNIFNAEVEAEWKMYFESLSDEELLAADTEELFGGLRDRIERAAKAHREALNARGMVSE
jgi:hypothetical protein